MRIYVVSDLHTDFAENRHRLQQISSTIYLNDTLIVAGDIADNLRVIEWTLRILKSRFNQVFYVPGNHELWVRDGKCDSIEKFHQVLTLCDEIGILTHPDKAGDIWIVPLFSWYEPAYDTDGDADASSLDGWSDFYFCKWPDDAQFVTDYFLTLNERRIRKYDSHVITFSHFLPRRELLPSVDKLYFKGLPLVAGTLSLDLQIRELSSAVHIFGHSHIDFDKVIHGVRYIQHAFDYRSNLAGLKAPLKQIEVITNEGETFNVL